MYATGVCIHGPRAINSHILNIQVHASDLKPESDRFASEVLYFHFTKYFSLYENGPFQNPASHWHRHWQRYILGNNRFTAAAAMSIEWEVGTVMICEIFNDFLCGECLGIGANRDLFFCRQILHAYELVHSTSLLND